jgi:putative hemolysin
MKSNAFWLHDPLEDIQKSLQKSVHSIFPVCGSSTDDIIGIITVRDFLENFRKQGFILESIVKTPLFIPEALPATRILNRFRRLKQYFGIVIDEYGGFKGIVTLHDLAECILGDLPDVNETSEPDIIVREDLSLLVNGHTPIEELCDVLHTKVFIEKEHRYRTVAGLVIAHIGRIPETGEKVVIDDYSFEIVDMDVNRVDKILVSRVAPKNEAWDV